MDRNIIASHIDTAMSWAQTPQGHSYWSSVCEALRYGNSEPIAPATKRPNDKCVRNMSAGEKAHDALLALGGFRTAATLLGEILGRQGHAGPRGPKALLLLEKHG